MEEISYLVIREKSLGFYVVFRVFLYQTSFLEAATSSDNLNNSIILIVSPECHFPK